MQKYQKVKPKAISPLSGMQGATLDSFSYLVQRSQSPTQRVRQRSRATAYVSFGHFVSNQHCSLLLAPVLTYSFPYWMVGIFCSIRPVTELCNWRMQALNAFIIIAGLKFAVYTGCCYPHLFRQQERRTFSGYKSCTSLVSQQIPVSACQTRNSTRDICEIQRVYYLTAK